MSCLAEMGEEEARKKGTCLDEDRVAVLRRHEGGYTCQLCHPDEWYSGLDVAGECEHAEAALKLEEVGLRDERMHALSAGALEVDFIRNGVMISCGVRWMIAVR